MKFTWRKKGQMIVHGEGTKTGWIKEAQVFRVRMCWRTHVRLSLRVYVCWLCVPAGLILYCAIAC